MRSGQPKILHLLGGRPLVHYPVALVREAGVAGSVVVVAPGAAAVRAALAESGAAFVEQPEPRGTGHALLQARAAVPATATELLLLYGDVPLLRSETLAALLAHHRARRAAATVLTFVPADPTGYGRVRRRRDGRVRAIVEERDATPAERRGRECNSGIYCFDPRAALARPRRGRAARAPQRPGGAVPHRRRRAARPGRRPGRGRACGGSPRGRRRERPAAARRARGAPPRAHARGAHDRGGGRRRSRGHLRRRDRDGRPRHGPPSRGAPRGPHGDRRAVRDRDGVPAHRHDARGRRHPPALLRARRLPGGGRRHAGPVRAPPPGHAGRARRGHRQLHRDQAGDDRAGREGPPRRVHRRRHGRGGGEHRRGRHHLQLRRGAEASDPDRGARLRRDERESRRPR